jgi:hypothetical protein
VRSFRRPCWARIHERGFDLLILRSSARLSSGDLVLVCEAAEHLLSPDPVLGEVDLRRLGVSLSRWQLPQCAMRPGCVVVDQVFGPLGQSRNRTA